ncbi:hypothetical protein CA13_18270 [Planctomycetes bacterium CA13]|uniref:Uncharacterized protein n=1 Tax=Novipirellula herctigrandis TaxID=2527986 RepID=A0A5C5Z0S8_9BACT|nr:hypothetical protein CA13_18270 [Planctomycetes bacterium CA13]
MQKFIFRRARARARVWIVAHTEIGQGHEVRRDALHAEAR